MGNVYTVRRSAESLEYNLGDLLARLRGRLASLCALLDEESELLRRVQEQKGVQVWILPLLLIERNTDTAYLRGAARRRAIAAAKREVAGYERALSRTTDELERRNIRKRLEDARQRLRDLQAGG